MTDEVFVLSLTKVFIRRLLGMVKPQRLHVFEGLLMISRDVAAGICILQEAGGLITTANPPEDLENAPIRDGRLGSRLYQCNSVSFISDVD